jgi:hypothetical protein
MPLLAIGSKNRKCRAAASVRNAIFETRYFVLGANIGTSA